MQVSKLKEGCRFRFNEKRYTVKQKFSDHGKNNEPHLITICGTIFYQGHVEVSVIPSFEGFKDTVIRLMVFKPVSHKDFHESVNYWYIEFKEGIEVYDTIEEFCEEHFQDVSFDTHTYMLKSKAIKLRDEKRLLKKPN